EPFCNELRELILCAGERKGLSLVREGTYVCTNGPRLETKAEIRYFSVVGADIVGMTLMPEASLARELEICFASISVVTNYAAGISKGKLTTTEVVETMKASIQKIGILIKELITVKREERKGRCLCQEALKEARM
ncbi:MAG: MTAP family purine nucleoside phosphorylase, partial [Thermodesulfovibrionales bacterium]